MILGSRKGVTRSTLFGLYVDAAAYEVSTSNFLARSILSAGHGKPWVHARFPPYTHTGYSDLTKAHWSSLR